MKNSKIYIACLQNNGTLSHRDGYEMRFVDNEFIITDDSITIDADDINPDGWEIEEVNPISDKCWLSIENISDLDRGDIVKHCKDSDSHSFVVDSNYGSRATAIDSIDITNPKEWLILANR